MVRHLEALAEWQKTKLYDYSGRASAAEPRFPAGECGMFFGLVGLARRHSGEFASSRSATACCPIGPTSRARRRTRSSAARRCGCCAAGPEEEYAAVARFFAYLSQPQVQASWHQNTGYLPITGAAYELSARPALL